VTLVRLAVAAALATCVVLATSPARQSTADGPPCTEVDRGSV
jgi:hypothetical protein